MKKQSRDCTELLTLMTVMNLKRQGDACMLIGTITLLIMREDLMSFLRATAAMIKR